MLDAAGSFCIIMIGLALLFLPIKGKAHRASRLLIDGRLLHQEGRYAEAERPTARPWRSARLSTAPITSPSPSSSTAWHCRSTPWPATTRPRRCSAEPWRSSRGAGEAPGRRGPHPRQPGRALPGTGRYADAESCHPPRLTILETLLGPDHPDVAACLTNLAHVE